MLSKEERIASRARGKAAEELINYIRAHSDRLDYGEYCLVINAVQDIPALLDSLDEMEAQNQKHTENLMADRGYFKARAEEVESENERWNNANCNTCPIRHWENCEEACESKATLIRELADMAAALDRWKVKAEALEYLVERNLRCVVCVHEDKSKKEIPCNLCKYSGGSVASNWEFDYDRFSKGGDPTC